MKAQAIINNLAFGGIFAGKIISAEVPDIIGMTVFVPFAAPGEIVEVAITERKKSFLQAELIKIETESKLRVSPLCPYFQDCGGCELQHLPIELQRELKADLFKSSFKKICNLEFPIELQSLSANLPDYHYRKRISLHVRDGKIGFYARSQERIVPIAECSISMPAINQALKLILSLGTLPEKIGGLNIEASENDTLLAVKVSKKLSLNKEEVAEIAEFFKSFSRFRIFHDEKQLYSRNAETISLGWFSQVNPLGNKVIQEKLLELLQADKGRNVLELYAGAGNFSFPLAEAGHKITAVELSDPLVNIAKKILAEKQLSNISFIPSSAENYTKRCKLPEVLLLDPPRAGAIEALQNADFNSTEKIVYVSCNIPTLCRDINYLLTQGFNLSQAFFVDLFPQTHHAEFVIELTGKAGLAACSASR